MKTQNHSTTRSLVLAALFLALAFVLPMVTGHVPQVGNMLCPMHFSILLCGFVLAGLTGSSFPFSAFLSGALLTAVPGIAAQLVLIPLILVALQKAKVMD